MRNQYTMFSSGTEEVAEDDFALLRSIIARRRTGRSSANASRRLLKRYGRIGRVLRAPPEELAEVRGVGPAVASEIIETRRLVDALVRADVSATHVIDEPDAVFRFCRTMLSGVQREELHVLYLDRAYRLVRHECLQTGTIDHVAVYPREVLGRAIQHGASALILVHNHPSGCSRPSGGDIAMTRELETAARHLRLEIADHIIVGGKENFSFRLHGLLPSLR